MAELNEFAGPSGIKRKRVVKVRNPNNLSVEEMLESMFNSDSEIEVESEESYGCKLITCCVLK